MRILWVLAVLAPIVSLGAYAAGSTVVTGKIVDEGGVPIRTAQVRVRGSRTSTLNAVALDGTFRIQLAAEETSVIADITAPSFEKRTRTLVVNDGKADAGTLTMTRQKGLAVSGFTISQSGNGEQNYLDLFVQNDSAKAMAVVEVSVQGMRKRTTTCLDATPGLQLTIVGQFHAGRVVAEIATLETFDSVEAKGKFLHLGCRQQQLDLDLPYSFSLDPSERIKLRVAIPSVLRSTENSSPATVRMDEFAIVTLTLHSSEGRAVTVKREKADPEP